jgi:hypothetical protein
MHKKTVLLLSIVLLSVAVRAQINMTLQVPPYGVLLKSQLWNMTLVNTGNAAVAVQLGMTMIDEKTNQPVLSASAPVIILNRGARQIQARDLSPILYSYESVTVTDRNPNGFLPLGQYRICYTVSRGPDAGAPIETCIELAIDPMSPPLLNTPADEAQIYTVSPQFTWLPPTPAGIFSDLSYDLVLVEVIPGQATADAIEQNVPIYSGGLIRDPYLNYATSYTSLDTGRLYAWRVVALNNGQPAAMTDIWTFRVVQPPLPSLHTTNNPYLSLKRGLDPSIAAGTANMRFNYDNAPADTAARYTITSLSDRGNPVVQQGQLLLRRGQNLLQVTLSGTAGYDAKKIYLFQLFNSRNETWTIKFTGAASK